MHSFINWRCYIKLSQQHVLYTLLFFTLLHDYNFLLCRFSLSFISYLAFFFLTKPWEIISVSTCFFFFLSFAYIHFLISFMCFFTFYYYFFFLRFGFSIRSCLQTNWNTNMVVFLFVIRYIFYSYLINYWKNFFVWENTCHIKSIVYYINWCLRVSDWNAKCSQVVLKILMTELTLIEDNQWRLQQYFFWIS